VVAFGAAATWSAIAASSAARVVSAEGGAGSVLMPRAILVRGVGAASLFGALRPDRQGQVPLSRAGPLRRPRRRVGFGAMNTAVKWVGGAVAVPVIALALYIGAVVQVYVLAFVVQIIGNIFG
jgi:hypothetical protein